MATTGLGMRSWPIIARQRVGPVIATALVLWIAAAMQADASPTKKRTVASLATLAQTLPGLADPREQPTGPLFVVDSRTWDGGGNALNCIPIFIFLALSISMCKKLQDLLVDGGAYFVGLLLVLVVSGAGLFHSPESPAVAALAMSVLYAAIESFRNKPLLPHWLSCLVWGAVHGTYLAIPMGRLLDASAPLRFDEVRPYAVGVAFVIAGGIVGAAVIRVGLAKLRDRRACRVVGGLVGLAVALTTAYPLVLGAGRVSGAQAERAFLLLHERIYDAYSLNDESEIYDTLADCMAGDLLELTYEDLTLDLVENVAEGIVWEIESPKPRIIVFRRRSADSFVVDYTWIQTSTITHPPDLATLEVHQHRQRNQYTARYTVDRTEVGWRIVDWESRDARQLAGD